MPMRASGRAALLAALLYSGVPPSVVRAQEWTDRSPHKESHVTAKGIRLHYLDWGGSGEPLVLLTGLGVTPHIFDNLAPQFTARARVVGYTRRGLGKSDKPEKGYDTATLAEDLRGFLDALKIDRAILVGWSLAGTEMTHFAARYPARVRALVYLDAAYDYEKFPDVWAKDPLSSAPSTADLASFAASRRWFTRVFGTWSDAVEADARAINLQPDGTMKVEAMSAAITEQLMAGMVRAKPDFAKTRSPVLAFYAVSATHPFVHLAADAKQRAAAEAYWRDVFIPLQRQQIDRLRRERPDAKIVELAGAQHMCFINPRDERRIVTATREFLAGLR